MSRMTPARHASTSRHRRAVARRESGAASLIVVMVLFFLMSLVAAYTSRNLIFEQRTSVNQYRATQAYEAAEAGLEWALTLLNSGRIGADCLETGAATTDTSFRQRYLAIDADTGIVTPRVGPTSGAALWPSCVSDGSGGWTCSCPSDAAPSLSAPSGGGVFPAFRVRFTSNELTRPGLIRIESNGCTKLDDACLNHPASAQNLEGRANVAAIVALTSALPTPPGAALSVTGTPSATANLSVYNTDVDLGGITVQAGGAFGVGSWTLRSLPGTPASASIVPNEGALGALHAVPDRAFASVFSMWPATYRNQQAAVVVDCPTDCRPNLATAVAMNPDRVIWATTADPTGTITLATAGAIGSVPGATVAGPAVIVFDRPVDVTASGISLFGFAYSRGGTWSGTNPLEIQGAAFIEGDLASTANATVVMNSAVLKSLRLRSGSFVRAPGGWDDFRGRAP
jgi:hypothetical protein